ncbi:MAG: hypothetical protein IMW85_07425 [Thermicanus sp.]|nr:hypothetical protein [Thermicanus sp.]
MDSYYFKTLAELGLPGVLLLAWLLFSVGFLLYRLWSTTKGRREHFLLGGILIGLTAVIFHNGVENIFEVPFMNSYFWFLTGLMLSYPYWGEHEKMGTEAFSEERRAA